MPGSLVGDGDGVERTRLVRSIETVLFLVVVATVVATFARRLRVPAPSLLVVAGVVVGLLPGVPPIIVTPEVVSLVVLPPLLFAAGEELPWRDLRAVWKPVTVLAVGLVVASAAAVGGAAALLTPLPVGMAFVLGALLAATDPVAVAALGRRLSLPPRVQALVQAESLFNDATSLLLFRLTLSLVVTGGAIGAGRTAREFALLAGGGVAAGALVAAGAFLLRRRTEDPVLEAVLSLVTPYAAYVLAESVGGSGVTGVVVAAVALGTQSRRLTTARVRLQLGAINGTVVFLLESVVFALIGLQLPGLIRGLPVSEWLLPSLVLVAVMLVARVLWVFPLSAVLHWRRGGHTWASWQVPAVVSWAGARGVVPLAAALSIPLTTSTGADLGSRNLVLLLTSCVIVTSLVVQGFTLAPLVRRSGIAMEPLQIQEKEQSARVRMAQAALAHLDQLDGSEHSDLVARLRASWQERLERHEAEHTAPPGTTTAGRAYRRLRRELLTAETAELHRLYESGAVDDATRRRLQRLLDLEHTGLGDDG